MKINLPSEVNSNHIHPILKCRFLKSLQSRILCSHQSRLQSRTHSKLQACLVHLGSTSLQITCPDQREEDTSPESTVTIKTTKQVGFPTNLKMGHNIAMCEGDRHLPDPRAMLSCLIICILRIQENLASEPTMACDVATMPTSGQFIKIKLPCFFGFIFIYLFF